MSSVRKSHQYANELLRLFTLLVFIPAGKRQPHTLGYVLFNKLAFGARNCSAYSLELGDDIDTIAVIFDHTLYASHLTFNPAKPVQHLRLFLHKLLASPNWAEIATRFRQRRLATN
jgi:hypothetical protein